MPLSYDTNANTEGGGEFEMPPPGEYMFKVDTCEETTFSSGNRGIKAKLLVDTGKRDMACYVNLPYTDNMMWKVRHFVECLGFDFKNPPEAWQMVGRTGSADFVHKDGRDKDGKPNGRKNLDAKDFVVEEPLPNVTRGGAKAMPPGASTNDDAPPF
jgi:hypothetical protein